MVGNLQSQRMSPLTGRTAARCLPGERPQRAGPAETFILRPRNAALAARGSLGSSRRSAASLAQGSFHFSTSLWTFAPLGICAFAL